MSTMKDIISQVFQERPDEKFDSKVWEMTEPKKGNSIRSSKKNRTLFMRTTLNMIPKASTTIMSGAKVFMKEIIEAMLIFLPIYLCFIALFNNLCRRIIVPFFKGVADFLK